MTEEFTMQFERAVAADGPTRAEALVGRSSE
jgi:hypothetical protein